MTQQLQAAQALAAGFHTPANVASPFAAIQAAWRFLANPRVTLPQLAEPLRQAGRDAAAASQASHLLVVHDWSFLSFATHHAKTDRVRHGKAVSLGYDLATALLVDGGTGAPLAPMEIELTTSDGVVSSRAGRKAGRAAKPHIDQVLETMEAASSWGVSRPMVHVIDREADGLAQFRQWSAAGHRFVVRIDAVRTVQWGGRKRKLPEIAEQLRLDKAFTRVETDDKDLALFVAEATVTYTQPGRVRRGKKRVLVPGEPLSLRLVVTQIRDEEGRVTAEWFLATNLGADVPASRIGQWYAWRWRIESFFKLLKGHGQQVESWQQESGTAIAKRLAVTAMACVMIWQLERDGSPEGTELASILVRLSGRQTKRSRPVTAPAMLAGLEKLMAVLQLLENTTVAKLRMLLNQTLPLLLHSG